MIIKFYGKKWLVRVRKRIGNNYSELAFESTLNKDNVLKMIKKKWV